VNHNGNTAETNQVFCAPLLEKSDPNIIEGSINVGICHK